MKRNIDMHTSADEARKNILLFLLRVAPDSSFRGAAKSALGFAAFPGYDFKNPQGAAFSVAKIARKIEDEGLIATKYPDTGGSGIYLTGNGRRAAHELKSERAPA